MTKYTPVIGLEIHVELKTKSKMFCQCSANYFGKKPNTNTCPVCLGLPGALPVPNQKAIKWAIKIGQSLNCIINKHSKFDRKHYFYPDLPKGYQISQYDEPFSINGKLEIRNQNTEKTKFIGITRVHLEEDTGKLIHIGSSTLVDFNRSGVPLVEIVTEPVFDNAEDVKIFLIELHTIIRYLDVSDANMEEGSMRMEPNISLRVACNAKRVTLPNYKVEVKNINSFNFAKRAIEYELKRQAKILDKNEIPLQETRGYDESKGITYTQRAKEEAQDYRYFPEPDIPPMEFTDEEIENIKSTIPELPMQKMKRIVNNYKIKPSDAHILTRDMQIGISFEDTITDSNITKFKKFSPQYVANLFVNKLLRLKSNKSIKSQIQMHLKSSESLERAFKSAKNELQLTSTIDDVIKGNSEAVDQYKKGKTTVIMFLIGQVMKEMKGQADAQKVNKLLRKKIEEI